MVPTREHQVSYVDNAGEIVSSPPGSRQRSRNHVEVFQLNLSLIRSFSDSVVARTMPVSDELRLRLAIALVERKTRRIVETASKLFPGGVSQQHLQTIVAEADRVRMKTAARLGVPAGAIGARSESLNLLRSLSVAKSVPQAVVIPVVVALR